MATVTRSVCLAADADTVWDVVGDFARIDEWHPRVSRPALRPSGAEDRRGAVATLDPTEPGVERVFFPGTVAEWVERLDVRDDRVKRLEYAIRNRPFEVRDHRTSILVRPLEHGCEVRWTAAFRADPELVNELNDALGDGVFDVGLDALADRFGRL